jgi:hypothetical protein
LSAQRFGRQAANTACRKLWKAKENKETGTKFTRRSRSGTSETKPKKIGKNISQTKKIKKNNVVNYTHSFQKTQNR